MKAISQADLKEFAAVFDSGALSSKLTSLGSFDNLTGKRAGNSPADWFKAGAQPSASARLSASTSNIAIASHPAKAGMSLALS